MAVTTSSQPTKQGMMRRPLHSVPEVPSSAEDELYDDRQINSLRKSVSQRLKEESSSADPSSSPLLIAAINGTKSQLQTLLKEYSGDINSGDKIGRTPLMYSILGDQFECAETLIKAGADVNQTDVDERTALHWASYQGSHKFVKLLLEKGAKPHCQDKEGRTALHLALTHDNIRVMTKLLKHLKESEIDCADKNGMTPLHFSVFYERPEQTKLLLHAKASPDCQDADKKTVLHWAKENKNLTIVRMLMNYEPVTLVLNSKDSEGRTALHLAVAANNRTLVGFLTSFEDCSLSEQDHMQRTPFHWAAILGHTDLVELLLGRGANYSLPDKNGVRPLHLAAQGNFGKTVTVMLKDGRVEDIPDSEGRTALMWAVAKGAFEALTVLLNYKQDVLVADKSGATALHMAVDGGHLDCVKALIRNQASVNAPDSKQHTPLFCACQMGHKDIVEYLLKHGATVDLEDKEGRTPLHWAAVGGRTVICKMLLDNGLRANKRDKLGRPALHYAAYGGFHGCISLLLESGIDVDAKDKTGVTALHWACASGSLDTVKLLFRFDAFPNYRELEGERLTPLDYAIIRDHQDVAQFMMERGALTMAGIQELAATEIQRIWRGYHFRKTFTERKELYKIHEKKRKQIRYGQSVSDCLVDEPIDMSHRASSSHKYRSKSRYKFEETYDTESDISRESGLSRDSVFSHGTRDSAVSRESLGQRKPAARRNNKPNNIEYPSYTETDDDLYYDKYAQNEKVSSRNDRRPFRFGKEASYGVSQSSYSEQETDLHGRDGIYNRTGPRTEKKIKSKEKIGGRRGSYGKNIENGPQEKWNSLKRDSSSGWHFSEGVRHHVNQRFKHPDIDNNEIEFSNGTEVVNLRHRESNYENDSCSDEYSQYSQQETVSTHHRRSSSSYENEDDYYEKEMQQHKITSYRTLDDDVPVPDSKPKNNVESPDNFDSRHEEQLEGIENTRRKKRPSVLADIRLSGQKSGRRQRQKKNIESNENVRVDEKDDVRTILNTRSDDETRVNGRLGRKYEVGSINRTTEEKPNVSNEQLQRQMYSSRVGHEARNERTAKDKQNISAMKPWQVYKQEQERVALIRLKTRAAIIIQRAFRQYLERNRPVSTFIDDLDSDADEQYGDEIVREIAALVIQLEWRKYMKRKLVREKNEDQGQERVVVDDKEQLRLLAARQKKPKVLLQRHASNSMKSRTIPPKGQRSRPSPKAQTLPTRSSSHHRTTSFPLLHQGIVTSNTGCATLASPNDGGTRRRESENNQKTLSLGRKERSSPQIQLNKEQSRPLIVPPKKDKSCSLTSLSRERSSTQLSQGSSAYSTSDRRTSGTGKSHSHGTTWSSNMQIQSSRTYR